MAQQKPGPKALPPNEKTTTASVSLVPEDWVFLKALAAELQARGSTDPLMSKGRPTASAAIRWLIDQERRKPRRKRGSDDEVYFGADGGRVRVLSRTTGTTTVQESGQVDLNTRRRTASTRTAGRKRRSKG